MLQPTIKDAYSTNSGFKEKRHGHIVPWRSVCFYYEDE